MRPKRRPRSSRPRTGDAPLPPEEPRRVQAHVHREPGLSSLEIGGGAMGVESPGEVVEERPVQGLLGIAPSSKPPANSTKRSMSRWRSAASRSIPVTRLKWAR